MVNYENGKVYKIEPVCGHEDYEQYYGSTTKKYLSQRFDGHNIGHKRWKNGKAGKCSVYDLFEKYGVDNCKIILVEKYPCSSKDELIAKESEYIKNEKCVNKVIPNRTTKEWYSDNKERLTTYKKNYYLKNKAKIDEKANLYALTHQEQLKTYHKQYKAKHQDEISKYKKDYNRAYNEIYKTTVSYKMNHSKTHKCTVCRCEIKLYNKTRHEKTFQHRFRTGILICNTLAELREFMKKQFI